MLQKGPGWGLKYGAKRIKKDKNRIRPRKIVSFFFSRIISGQVFLKDNKKKIKLIERRVEKQVKNVREIGVIREIRKKIMGMAAKEKKADRERKRGKEILSFLG